MVGVSSKSALSLVSCAALSLGPSGTNTGLMLRACEEVGSTFSSSSMMRAAWLPARLRMKRSLKRGTTSWCEAVRSRLWMLICIVYSWERERSAWISMNTTPLPLTVSTQRDSTLGVSCSNSCSTRASNVWPTILFTSL